MPRRFTITEKWIDHWFHRLTPISKLFFMYLCENVDIAGIWEIDRERAAFDTGVTEGQIESALREIEKCYISDGKFLWVKNFIKYQGNLPLNENVNAHKGIIRRINQSSMRGRILEELQKNEQLTLWQGFVNPSGNGKGKGNGKGIKKCLDKKDEKFDQFWAAYPKKVGKGAARRAFEKIKPSDELLQKILSAVEQQSISEQWLKEGGRYIPNPSTWLNQERWDDELIMKENQYGSSKVSGSNQPTEQFVR